MSRYAQAFGVGIVLGLLIFWGWENFRQIRGAAMGKARIHRLLRPLRIATVNPKEQYFLPAGTVLYFDKSMSEGFDRYRIYVNVEGARWTLSPVEKDGLIAPISAYVEQQMKPPNVPNDAFYLGGSDGGVFILLKSPSTAKHPLYSVSVFSDQSGKILFDGLLKCVPPISKPIDPADTSQFSGWSGSALYLDDGRKLVPASNISPNDGKKMR